MPEKPNNLILYNLTEGKVNVNVHFAEEDVWPTNNLLVNVYATLRQLIDYHINNNSSDGELLQEATCKDFLLVQKEGNRNVERSLPHYNLDVLSLPGKAAINFLV